MELVDLSHTLQKDMPIYPGDPAFQCCPALTVQESGVNVQSVRLGSHCGTHIDAPYHFFENGDKIEELPLSNFLGPAVVVDVTGKAPRQRIVWADVVQFEQRIRQGATEGSLLLFRTGWSRYWGTDEYFNHPFFDGEIAQRLVDIGIRVIGVDTLSPDETHLDDSGYTTMDFSVHKIVLGAGAIIAENLTNLEAIQHGDWMVSMAPLKIVGSDGSPVRALAWRTI
ncbi:hypothetical protein PHLCEN_2v9937 [Hermanssonia centrifuga]|uniref:Cyclase n=1 Tax=Hermanssonia centrifuga TaxID=98765 RepID=A0A2R6NPD2_9APHY|nr:hypothetical protein PHLCEN_2v9937 [Hermanssonia centrifuga]